VPIYLKSRKADGNTYYKLSMNLEEEGGYEPFSKEPWFWGFNEGASPGCPVVPVYEHGVPEAICWAFGDYLLGRDLPNGQTLESWLVFAAQLMNSALPIPKDMGYGAWVSDPQRELKEYCGKFTHEYYGPIEIKLDEGNEPGNSRRLKLVVGPDRREVSLNMWDGDTFVYQTFGENAVGLSAVEFDMTTPGKNRVGVKNLPFSETNPDYSETGLDPKEFAWFTPEAGS
jgi:Domain of unknown function (DUF3471)